MSTGTLREPCNATYVLVTGQPVVACDIAEIITSFDPQAQVIVLSSLDDVATQLPADTRIDVAIIECGPAAYVGSALCERITLYHARAVLFGNDAEEEPPHHGTVVLQRPFATETLLRLLSARSDRKDEGCHSSAVTVQPIGQNGSTA